MQAEQPVASYGNPQLEDGHTRIANELLDAIIQFKFSIRQLKVVLFVLRRTYGWNKKADVMSLSQILAGTGIRRDHAGITIDELISMNVLYPKQVHHKGQLIELNKKYKEWVCTQNRYSVPESGQRCTQTGLNGVPKSGTTKDNTKNNIKDIQPIATLLALGVEKQFAQDWLKIRAKKKLAFTQTSIDKIILEGEKVGFTLNQAIKKCCEESWGGFKASWLNQTETKAVPDWAKE